MTRRDDCMAGVRGLELRYPNTSYIFEMSMITVVGSAETRQQRLFAFELRRWGTRSSGLLPGSSHPMLCGGAYALEPRLYSRAVFAAPLRINHARDAGNSVAVGCRIALVQPAFASDRWRRFDETGRDVYDLRTRPRARKHRLIAEQADDVAEAIERATRVHYHTHILPPDP